jgi:general secretion pathway protein G
VARAKSDLSAISAALDLFDVDNARYPTQAEGLTALTLRPANLPAWHSYVTKLPSDPWGHPYVYHTPGKNGQPYDIYSCGPDGKEETADDIRE